MSSNDTRKILKDLGEKIGDSEVFLEREHREIYFSNLIPKRELFDWYIQLDIANSLSVYHFFAQAFNPEKLKILVSK